MTIIEMYIGSSNTSELVNLEENNYGGLGLFERIRLKRYLVFKPMQLKAFFTFESLPSNSKSPKDSHPVVQ